MARPNVIVIMADQLKATALPIYGNPDVRTPVLDRFAEESVRYDLAFAAHPLCTPSRVSLWTGAYPHDHGVRTNEAQAPKSRDNYLRQFHQAGYRLALIGKNHCFGSEDLALFDEVEEFSHRGRTHASDARDDRFRSWLNTDAEFDRLWHAHPTPVPQEECPAARITEEASRFVRTAAEPFLLWMSLPEPHEPYYAPEPFASMYDPERIHLPEGALEDDTAEPVRRRLYRELCGFDDMDEASLRTAVATYYAMVSFVDSCIGRLLDTLTEADRDKDTIVVFLADHGDFAGERGLMVKCNSLIDALTRVPLVIRIPGIDAAGDTVADPVSLIDVMPTVAHIASVTAPTGSRGRVLPGLGIPTEARSAVFAEYGAGSPPMTYDQGVSRGHAQRDQLRPLLRAAEAEGRSKMVRTRRWKYIYDPMDPVDELYDMEADARELHNLAADPAHGGIVADMRRRLLDWSIRTEDAEPTALYFDPGDFSPRVEPHYAPFGA
ncbi:sulfatase-like hydrolase/transferase [Microbacterium awajiense]|uniref:Sulfatase-like hydrolase/transferase n=1 Tax=Microbacterium awajiense TaxID=415214 RepID=A0ABP7AJT9_9MICO